MTSSQIDYLFEDPPIPQQKYALISIVGPHMPQKCDVWGLKIRGVADELDKAKSMTQRLMRIDNNYDIYTVEVGKFFPLAVEPHEVSNVEYQNDMLNKMMKTYLENREYANEQWHARKTEMMKEAIREGKAQEEMATKPEHPVAVLQRVHHLKESIQGLQKEMDKLQTQLEQSKTKFEQYTNEDKALAYNQLQQLNSQGSSSGTSNVQEISENIDDIVNTLKEKETKLEQGYNANTDVEILTQEISVLKAKLTDSQKVNDYINSNYSHSEYDYLVKNTKKH